MKVGRYVDYKYILYIGVNQLYIYTITEIISLIILCLVCYLLFLKYRYEISNQIL